MFAPSTPFRIRALQSSKRGLWDECFVCEATAGLLRARRGPEPGPKAEAIRKRQNQFETE